MRVQQDDVTSPIHIPFGVCPSSVPLSAHEIELKKRRRRKLGRFREKIEAVRCDENIVAPLVKDNNDVRLRRNLAAAMFLLACMQLVLMAIQVFGVLVEDADYIVKKGESRSNWKYHAFVLSQSVLVFLQLVGVTWWYVLRVKNLSYFDRLWLDTPLLYSSLRGPWLIELLVLLLHEPPFLVVAWENSYKLQILALFRFYTLFTFMRSQSRNSQQGGRLITTIARVTNDKKFQVRAWMATYPIQFVVLCTVIGWFLASFAMYIAEEGVLELDDSMWLCFITMTTVGYGDLSPTTQAGRTVAAFSAIHGLVSSALLINIVSNLFTLSRRQQRVVEFMEEAQMSSEIELLAAVIVQAMWRDRKARRNGNSGITSAIRIKHLCGKLRTTRRKFQEFRRNVHHSVDNADLHMGLLQLHRKVDRLVSGMLPPNFDPSDPSLASEPIAPGNDVPNIQEALNTITRSLSDISERQNRIEEMVKTIGHPSLPP